MGPERLELSHIAALDPKSSASTNFATGPWFIYLIINLFSGCGSLLDGVYRPSRKTIFNRFPRQSATGIIAKLLTY